MGYDEKIYVIPLPSSKISLSGLDAMELSGVGIVLFN